MYQPVERYRAIMALLFCVCQCYGTLNIIERTLLKEEELTLKQAVDVAVSMEVVETEVSKERAHDSVYTMV